MLSNSTMEAPSQSTVLMEFQTNEYNINEIDSKYINDSLPHDSFLLIHSRLISEAFIPAIVELLEKYAGHTKEIYRKMANGAGICSILFALRENSFVSVQLKSSGLLLLNIDIASEERVCFDYRVNSIKDCSIKSIH